MIIQFIEDYDYIINIENYSFFNLFTIERFQKWVDNLVNNKIMRDRVKMIADSSSIFISLSECVQIAFQKTYEDMELPLDDSLFIANFNQNLAIVAYWMGKAYTPASMRNRIRLWIEMVFQEDDYRKYIVSETRLLYHINLSLADKLVRHQEILEKLRQYSIKYGNEQKSFGVHF